MPDKRAVQMQAVYNGAYRGQYKIIEEENNEEENFDHNNRRHPGLRQQ